MKIPRQYSLVKFNYEDIPVDYRFSYPFKPDRPYVFLGEIPNMPGHCVVAEHPKGIIYSGYHIENFVELTED